MSAKIINLKEVAGSRVRKNGILFPQIYRYTGYSKYSEDRTLFTSYSLNLHAAIPGDLAADYLNWDDITRTEVHSLDHETDSGWLIVRHHKNQDALKMYMCGLDDMFPDLHDHRWHLPTYYVTAFGFFSLIIRPARADSTDRLVVYVTQGPAENIPGLIVDHTMIIQSDGSMANDDALWPEPDLD
ncbi:MAG: hypothetical protein JWO43_101 [Candidatus Adlerbacteria bacterium]|nr:hypothetical protein [Candidatus Adlerbacteria bacterium]